MRRNFELPGTKARDPELAVFTIHTPFDLTILSSAVAAGFYTKLCGLHGMRHTFCTGAAFRTRLLPNRTAELAKSLTVGTR